MAGMQPTFRSVMQTAGRGKLEDHDPDAPGTRFEGRFVVFALSHRDGPLFEDASLFDPGFTADRGRGVASAHLVAVRSGITMEDLTTDGDDFVGHGYGRTSMSTRLRIYFDAAPDGSRSFDDRAAFTRGELVATYEAEEFFQSDARAGVFKSTVNYQVLSSTPFTLHGKTVDLGALYPSMVEMALGHDAEPDPGQEAIPDEPPFDAKGAGVFANRFAVGASLFAVC